MPRRDLLVESVLVPLAVLLVAAAAWAAFGAVWAGAWQATLAPLAGMTR